MDPYREKILDHYRHPRNFGPLAGATHRAHRLNQLCGDEVTLELAITGQKVKTARFHGRGCAISTAAASLLTETIAGKSLASLRRLTPDDVYALLGVTVSPAREQCALLGFQTLQEALAESAIKHH